MAKTNRQLLDKKISEAEWQHTLIDLLRAYGYQKIAHFRPARTDKGWRTAGSEDSQGFSDLVAVRSDPPRIVFLEAKRQSGKLSPPQQEWHDVLKVAGAEVYVARPSDYEMLEKELK